MKETLFITGGTGMVGRELVRALCNECDWDIYVLVHEFGADIDQDVFLKELLTPELYHHNERLHLVYGDVTKHDLGITPEVRDDLSKRITHCIHAAASTRFDLEPTDARAINVLGTQHVLDFARRCNHLQQYAFISTAYVSGCQTGDVYEQHYDSAPGFVNTYEQSKYEAEQLVRSYEAELPVCIYRLSTVVGHSVTGVVEHFTAPHHMLRILYIGMASMVPGTPDYSVDLIASDYTGKVVADLFVNHFAKEKIYHIVAGTDSSYTLREVLEESFKYLAVHDTAWGTRGYVLPSIVSKDAYDLFIRSVEETGNPIMLKVVNAVKHFAHQLTYPKDFDTTNVIAALPNYHTDMPNIRTYYSNVVEYCVRTRWGTQK